MNFNLSLWINKFVLAIYRLLVLNTYFILSNAILFVLFFIFQLTFNNFLFFLVPIYFLLVSVATQFKVMTEYSGVDVCSLRQYSFLYRTVLTNYWKIFLISTGLVTFLFVDFQILLTNTKIFFMLFPVLLTSMFLLSSMLFVFLLLTNNLAKSLGWKTLFFHAIFVSYKLPLCTLINCFLFCFMFLSIQFYSLLYVCFLGGLINCLIFHNLKRKFSTDLFFEQQLLKNKSEL